jgi:hypothetical protein
VAVPAKNATFGTETKLGVGVSGCFWGVLCLKTAPLYADDEWPYVLTLLPHNLDESARAAGPLVRQRNIPSAAALIRLALAYAVSGLSLKDVAPWASALGLATISGPGLLVDREWPRLG